MIEREFFAKLQLYVTTPHNFYILPGQSIHASHHDMMIQYFYVLVYRIFLDFDG